MQLRTTTRNVQLTFSSAHFSTKFGVVANDNVTPALFATITQCVFRKATFTSAVVVSLLISPLHLSGQTTIVNYNLPLIVAPGEQIAPILVDDNKAGAFVIWQDERGNHTAIYAQHLNELSQPLWKQNGIAVAAAAKDQVAAVALADGNGGALIFWQDERNDDGDIYGQHIDGEGSLLWGDAGIPVIRANGKQAETKAVSDGAGGAFVVCRDFKSGNDDILAQRMDGNGKLLFEATGKALAQGAGNQVLGDITATPDGGFVLVWSDDQTQTPRVTVQRFDAKINPQWLTNLLVVTTKSEQAAPVVFVSTSQSDTRGSTFVIWSDDRNRNLDLYAQKISAAGLLQWGLAGIPVCKAAGDQYHQQIISDGNEGIFVVWEDKRSGRGDIYGQRLNGAGQALWANDGVGIAVVSQEQMLPRMASDGKGGLICVWKDDRGSGTNILAQRLDSNGKAQWVANGVFITNASGNAQRPAIITQPSSFLGPGGSFLAWDDTRRGNEDIFVQPLKGDGTLANVPPRILSSPITEAHVSEPYTYAVQAIDYDSADSLHLELSAAPAWLKIDNAQLQLFGTPGASDAGERTVTLVVKDKLGARASQTFTLTVVAINRAPVITSQPDTVAIEDQSYTYQIVAVDPDPGDSLTFSLDTNAAWLRLLSDGKIAGTPTNEQVGSYTVSVRVTDKKMATATQKFLLHVRNVNDPPFFISQPDTFAYVDSLYSYRVIAADMDRGDEVDLFVRHLPSWLVWNASTQTLQGRPQWQHLGVSYLMNVLARDLAGDSTVQAFRLHVLSLGAPDTVAPAAPQAVQIQPAQWSANKKFALRWQNPFDPSQIAGVFYKIGAPPIHDRDGTLMPIPGTVANAQIDLIVSQEGRVPVYLWLMDGRGNVDFHNAASVVYRYDATPPQPPQNLFPHRVWSRGDSLHFHWTPAVDTTSGIRRYHFSLDGAFWRYVAGDSSSFALIDQFIEKTFSWALAAEDSASNLSPPVTAFLQIDRSAPTLLHSAVDTATALTELIISAQAQDARSGLHEVRLHYRAAGTQSYLAQKMEATGATIFSTRLEASQVVTKGLEYYLEAVDSAGNRLTWPTDSVRNFQAIVVAASNVTAPQAFVAGRYQIFSVPYRLLDGSPAALLEDDLGNYDPTAWRLFRYQPSEGNVEFGKPNLEPFAPGRAFWLITTQPQNYDTGPAYSVSTNEAFKLVLQPGWNLIATPFDFPILWPAVPRPEGVENNLWAFDGTHYVSQQEVLRPWQGYFLRNLEAQPETLFIPPIARPSMSKPKEQSLLAAGISWQVRLRVSDGEFGDDENYLGVAARAHEAWDALDFSEPPTIGDHVALYFARRDWPRYAGIFTSDFRPENDNLQKWPFTVVASRRGLPVELTWEYSGNLPKAWIFILEDASGHLRRLIRPEKSENRIVFRATQEPREFIWWAGREERLAEAGVLQNLIPAIFQLAPSYPNPIRLAASSPPVKRDEVAVIRFGLPTPVAVHLTIFDLVGRKVRMLVAGENLEAGYHEVRWDGRDDNGHPASAGVYIYQLETSAFRASRKLVLLR